ncbi:dethiobiotin synthase [Corynebacterium sp.]|uniref:dethiobiotin synthase n=1 Tax=Corynebacterium sp. TaxID=1720 RepID=UPI0025C0583A|nr:dethiobiotin synthase [Corynebacterium sp.]
MRGGDGTVILLVTGTGTDVGKTVATAALAVCAEEAGHHVTVVKPVQTGEPPGHGDLRTVTGLTGVTDTHCLATCPEPLAPVAAARRAGVVLPGLDGTARTLRALDGPGRVVLVEGAGGLLVSLGGYTLADLAVRLGAPVVVVTTTVLGSLNHCALTLEALENRGIRCLGVIGGSVPDEPDVPTATTLEELRAGPWLGGIPAGAGQLDTETFRAGAVRWLDLPEP